MILVFGIGFGWLSIHRHEAYRTNAEDLGFTDQVLWNWLRGQAFRFSMYEAAEFTTDIDLSALERPDSLLAFHVEPMTALLAPVYWVIPDVRAMLALQALGWALGAWPAYRLARRHLGSRVAGLAVAGAYLLSPLGQWGVMSDLHTVMLAAPLLLLAADLADTGRRLGFLIVGLLAASAKEEVGLAVAGLGLLALRTRSLRPSGLTAIALGAGWSLACVALIIPRYAGTAVSPFTKRYAELGGSPGQALANLIQAPHLYLELLGRAEVAEYLWILLLTGGWLALLAPEFLIPLLPSLALNVLSNSPWMASGRAHYSAVILPFVTLAAIMGGARALSLVGRLRHGPRPQADAATNGWSKRTTRSGTGGLAVADVGRGQHALLPVVLGLSLLGTTSLAYRQAGVGSLADGFAVAQRTTHHVLADRLIAQIPPLASVSASSSLVPHLSQRPAVYLFPTVRDAEYVALDVSATPFPTSAGDVYLRVMGMLGSGDWTVLEANDGLLLLWRGPEPTRPLPDRFTAFARLPNSQVQSGAVASAEGRDDTLTHQPPLAAFLDGGVELVSGDFVPTGQLGPNGPLATLRTTWRVTRRLDGQPRPRLFVQLEDGRVSEYGDFAALWWYPPERWRLGDLVQLDQPGIAIDDVAHWWADVPRPPAPEPIIALSPSEPSPPQAMVVDPDTEQHALGALTVKVRRSRWQLTILDPHGAPLWEEAPSQEGERYGPLGFGLEDGTWWHLTRLTAVRRTNDGGVVLDAATNDPSGRRATVSLNPLDQHSFRLSLSLTSPEVVTAVSQAVISPPDERLVGFGERFTAVNQRGRVVTTWADDRRVAGYGDSTYAPLPFFISSRGYSIALETDVRSTFDLGARQADRYSWEAETSAMSLVFSYGPSPRDLVQQQVKRTGLPPLPPIWAFGVWKTAIGGQEQVLQEAVRLRELGVPVSALFVYDAVDTASNIGWPHVTFQGKRSGSYADLRAFTDRLHERGFKVLSYNTADFHLGRPNYDFPAEHGFLIRAPDGRPYVHPGFGLAWLDFSNPAAVDWWGLLWHRSLVDLGFDGGMLDLGELTPEDGRYANGLDGRVMHNRYPLLYARAAFEAASHYKPDSVVFVRSGAAGAQAFQHLQWPGDPHIAWSEANGLKSMLPAALSFGLSGFPYWHTEVGGYLAVGLPRASERELWFRWLQLGAFTSLLRDNYGDHQTGQEPIEFWSDASTIEAFRFYARLHNQLVPYIYSYARVASETGLPLMRHLALNYPADPRAWSEERQYTLGDEILVAPVLDEGARTWRVYLPAGQWVDFWSGGIFDGGHEIVVDAPLERIPVFVKAGAILPLAGELATLAPSNDPASPSWDGSLVVRAMPSHGPVASSFQLYDGTRLDYQTDGVTGTLVLRGAPQARALEARFPVESPPRTVLVNGTPTDDWTMDSSTGEAVVRARGTDVEFRIAR